jgi:hypothetical protein
MRRNIEKEGIEKMGWLGARERDLSKRCVVLKTFRSFPPHLPQRELRNNTVRLQSTIVTLQTAVASARAVRCLGVQLQFSGVRKRWCHFPEAHPDTPPPPTHMRTGGRARAAKHHRQHRHGVCVGLTHQQCRKADLPF